MAGKKGSTLVSRRVLKHKFAQAAAVCAFWRLSLPPKTVTGWQGGHERTLNPAHLFSSFIPMYAMDFCGRIAAAIAIDPLSASRIRALTGG
jgi:hypothetical protein